MKNLIAAALAFYGSFATGAAWSDEVRIGAFNYPPFLVVDDQNGVTGITAEILETSFAQMGHEVVFEVLPLVRTLTLAEEGSIDAIAFFNPAAADIFHMSDRTIGVLRLAFFVRADSDWQFDGTASLEGQRVAMIEGYDYSLSSPEYQAFVDSDPNIVTIGSPETYLEQVILMIEGNRVDTFNEAEAAMNYRLRLMGKQDALRVAGYLGAPLYMHTAFKPGPQGQLLKEQFDEGYTKAIQAGLLDDLLDTTGREEVN